MHVLNYYDASLQQESICNETMVAGILWVVDVQHHTKRQLKSTQHIIIPFRDWFIFFVATNPFESR